MQVRADQLAGHLQKGVRTLYTVWGDEPLLAQEAGDAIRSAARAAGCTERQVHTVAGAHFDWSSLLGDSMALSLFAERQLIEIRIPSGKPGKDGSEALQRYCQTVRQSASRSGESGGMDAVVTLVQLPRLDRSQQTSAWFGALDGAGITVRVDPIERQALPQWIAQRLARQQQRVGAGDNGERALAFFADRIEGNLLAAHQEVEKLGLLYPAGELSFEQIEAAVLNVARYDVFKLGEAVLAGQVARALRMLDGLRAEGEAAVLVHWTLAEDIRALKRVKDAQAGGKPLPMALREARVWGAKERLFERALPLLTDNAVAHLLEAAQVCDGLVKGLKHPDWPDDPWDGLKRLVLMLVQETSAATAAGHGRRVVRRLALSA
ncbi:MAG: DNA polymerase III subunit delta [Burkholderiaceae bacterium]